MTTVYMAGPINACTDEEATGWRREATAALADCCTILDPMRRDYRGREDDSPQDIVDADIADISVSDILLVNANRPSWGTAMEVRIAYCAGKRIVAFCAGAVSPWLRVHCNTVVPSLAEAVASVRRFAA